MNKPTPDLLRSGFTMTEVVIVLMLLAILGGLAIPNFIDMRRDTQITTLRSFASYLKTAVMQKKAQMYMRCRGRVGSNPSIHSILANDITAGGDCLPEEIPESQERKFFDSDHYPFQIPANPTNSLNNIAACHCMSPCDQACNQLGAVCYNESTGDFWVPGLDPSCNTSSVSSASVAP